MCFIKTSKTQKVQVAQSPIRVFKVLKLRKKNRRLAFLSKYRGMEYKPGETYTVKKFSESEAYKQYQINGGLHSYSSLKKAQAQTHLFNTEIIMQMTIPTGTEYYFNPKREEYVSLKLTFPKI